LLLIAQVVAFWYYFSSGDEALFSRQATLSGGGDEMRIRMGKAGRE
jgi:hypothetical protein